MMATESPTHKNGVSQAYCTVTVSFEKIFRAMVNILVITWTLGGQVMCKHDWVPQPEYET